MIAAQLSLDQIMEMEDQELVAACFAPMIQAYKEAETAGESFAEGGYRTLSKGQQALFGFWAYRTHAVQSAADLYWWTSFFMAQPKRWPSMLAGLRYFEDAATFVVLEEMEAELVRRDHPRSLERFDVSFDDLRNENALEKAVTGLYGRLLAASPKTTARIGGYIRRHASEFIA